MTEFTVKMRVVNKYSGRTGTVWGISPGGSKLWVSIDGGYSPDEPVPAEEEGA